MARKCDILAVKSWRVGGVEWRVSYELAGKEQHIKPDECGEADSSCDTIRVRKGMSRGQQVRTVCHELAHALGLDETEAGYFEALAGILLEHRVI